MELRFLRYSNGRYKWKFLETNKETSTLEEISVKKLKMRDSQNG